MSSEANTKYKNPVLKVISTPKGDFEVPPKYEFLKVVGAGAYGVVVAAKNTETGEVVAIKKVNDVFKQDREYQKRILREIKILRHFYHYPHINVIGLKDLIPPKSFEEFKDVYIVMELMSTDLRALIKSNQEFSDDNTRLIMNQLLLGLKFIHSAGVLHRDIKPSNILVNSDFVMKICDFGLSRSVDFDDPKQSTTYVATRWYRAPELLLMWDKSSKGIDVWSVGCIFAELLQNPSKRRPLFPGQNYLHQLDVIMNTCGKPADVNVKGCEKAKQYLKTVPDKAKKNFAELFPGADKHAVDLLDKMLNFDPIKRITTEDALAHSFLESIRDEEEETTCPTTFTYDLPDDVSKKDIKKIMYDEVMDWNRQVNGVDGDAIETKDLHDRSDFFWE